MTGGQMAPTTLLGMKTTTSPAGRQPNREGYPIRVCELLSSLEGAVYLERTAISSIKGIRRTKKAIREAFQTQLNREGFSLIEVLSPCPTNWKLNPTASMKWIDDVMSKYFPVGVVKDTRKESARDAD